MNMKISLYIFAILLVALDTFLAATLSVAENSSFFVSLPVILLALGLLLVIIGLYKKVSNYFLIIVLIVYGLVGIIISYSIGTVECIGELARSDFAYHPCRVSNIFTPLYKIALPITIGLVIILFSLFGIQKKKQIQQPPSNQGF